MRNLLNASVKVRDGKSITDMQLSLVEKAVLRKVLHKLDGTEIPLLLRRYGVIDD